MVLAILILLTDQRAFCDRKTLKASIKAGTHNLQDNRTHCHVVWHEVNHQTHPHGVDTISEPCQALVASEILVAGIVRHRKGRGAGCLLGKTLADAEVQMSREMGCGS